VKRYGVRPSVCPGMGPQLRTHCCRFAAVGSAGRRHIDRLLHGHRSATSAGNLNAGRKLDTDLSKLKRFAYLHENVVLGEQQGGDLGQFAHGRSVCVRYDSP